MARTTPFDNYPDQYEQWFSTNQFAFLSELAAIRSLIPKEGKGVEIGVGSGIFAAPLKIKEGCDPSETMRKKAAERGINAIACTAEDLPYKDNSFDFALMVTTICFVDDPQKTFQEIHRILKPEGHIIIAFVDKESPVGQEYQRHKEESLFYKDAVFFSTREICDLLGDNGFKTETICQTIFSRPHEISEIEQVREGFGEGSFIVIKAKNIIESSTKCMIDHYLNSRE
ncbi:MAG: class I SAM-dependent methyltransferase [Marinilabiliaceae bacterium]